MYTKVIRKGILDCYAMQKKITSPFLRFWAYPADFNAPKVVKNFPGAAHSEAMNTVSATQSIDGRAHVS
jgi:hypothetical protein